MLLNDLVFLTIMNIRKFRSRPWWLLSPKCWPGYSHHTSGDRSTITVGRHLKGISGRLSSSSYGRKTAFGTSDWSIKFSDQPIRRSRCADRGLWPEGISQRRFFRALHSAEFLHKYWTLLRHLSLLWSNLKQLWMLLHDVHQHVVDVAPQVKVHILLVLQGLPHLEKVEM